ncbi:hypothetical protein RFI_11847, partial [Reticulomyxa filosa]
ACACDVYLYTYIFICSFLYLYTFFFFFKTKKKKKRWTDKVRQSNWKQWQERCNLDNGARFVISIYSFVYVVIILAVRDNWDINDKQSQQTLLLFAVEFGYYLCILSCSCHGELDVTEPLARIFNAYRWLFLCLFVCCINMMVVHWEYSNISFRNKSPPIVFLKYFKFFFFFGLKELFFCARIFSICLNVENDIFSTTASSKKRALPLCNPQYRKQLKTADHNLKKNMNLWRGAENVDYRKKLQEIEREQRENERRARDSTIVKKRLVLRDQITKSKEQQKPKSGQYEAHIRKKKLLMRRAKSRLTYEASSEAVDEDIQQADTTTTKEVASTTSTDQTNTVSDNKEPDEISPNAQNSGIMVLSDEEEAKLEVLEEAFLRNDKNFEGLISYEVFMECLNETNLQLEDEMDKMYLVKFISTFEQGIDYYGFLRQIRYVGSRENKTIVQVLELFVQEQKNIET